MMKHTVITQVYITPCFVLDKSGALDKPRLSTRDYRRLQTTCKWERTPSLPYSASGDTSGQSMFTAYDRTTHTPVHLYYVKGTVPQPRRPPFACLLCRACCRVVHRFFNVTLV